MHATFIIFFIINYNWPWLVYQEKSNQFIKRVLKPLFLTLSLTFIFLLDKINIDLTL